MYDRICKAVGFIIGAGATFAIIGAIGHVVK